MQNNKQVPKPAAKRSRAAKRQAQSAKKNERPATPMVKRDRGPIFPASAAFGSMNKLAKTICAPRDMPPMRLPDVVRHRTDTKHLYVLTDYGMENLTPLTSDRAPLFGTTQLTPQQGVVILQRSPIAPLIYPVEWRSGSTTSSYNWLLAGRDRTVNPGNFTGIGGTENWMLYPVPGNVKAAPAAPLVTTPPADLSLLAPYSVAYEPTSTRGAPDGVNTEPAYIDPTGSFWGWFGGGRFVVNAVHYTAATGALATLPAGAGVVVSLTLQNYTGTADPLEVWTGSVQINTSTNFGAIVIEPTLPMGYYRFTVARVTYEAPTADYTYGGIGVRVSKHLSETVPGSATTWAMSHVFVNPMNPTIDNASYLFESVRVTSMAALVTNVTPSLSAGGDVYGVRVPDGELWTDFSLSKVLTLSGAQRTAYRGPLKSGAYTWMELPDDYNRFRDCVVKPGQYVANNGPTVGLPAVYINDGHPVHIIGWFSPNYTSFTGSTTRLQIRCDYHIEFVSSSQLAMNLVTPLKTDDLTDASIALANAPLFTENWVHLDQLWRSIKSTGAEMLKAGGKAAAGIAARDLAAALAAGFAL